MLLLCTLVYHESGVQNVSHLPNPVDIPMRESRKQVASLMIGLVMIAANLRDTSAAATAFVRPSLALDRS